MHKDREKKVIIFFLYCALAFIAGAISVAVDSRALKEVWVTIADNSHMADNITVWVDQPEKAHDGVLLLAAQFKENPAVILVNSKGHILHKWHLDKESVNPALLDFYGLSEKDLKNGFHAVTDAHLFPNGDLLATQDYREIGSYFRGLRLVRLDRDSQVIWQIPGNFHHDIQVIQDGTVYALDYSVRDVFPTVYDEKGKALFLDDIIRIISPDGKIQESFSIVDAFYNSPYSVYLSSFRLELPIQQLSLKGGKTLYDPLHINHIHYINAEQASRLPFAEAGDLLISSRGLDAIAIFRPSVKTIVWAAKGPWRSQHYVKMTDEGKILIFDNEGGSIVEDEKGVITSVRVLEFDPVLNITKSIYFNPSHRNSSFWRGYYERLENGSSIVASPESGRVLQIDDKGDIIWELRSVKDRDQEIIPFGRKMPSVRYYDRSYPEFIRH